MRPCTTISEASLPKGKRSAMNKTSGSIASGTTIHVTGGIQERLHLYFALLGLHAARAALFEKLAKKGRSPRFDPNSAHDTNITQHLAEGVFVITDDRRFIVDDVDATRSFQARWVRTPWEMLSADLPLGLPWGRTARRALERHTARTIDGLKEIETRCRGQWRR